MAGHARLIAIDRETAIEGQDRAQRRFLLGQRQARLRGGGERPPFGCGNLVLVAKGIRVGREDFREIDLRTLRIAWARRVEFVGERRFRRQSGRPTRSKAEGQDFATRGHSCFHPRGNRHVGRARTDGRRSTDTTKWLARAQLERMRDSKKTCGRASASAAFRPIRALLADFRNPREADLDRKDSRSGISQA